MIQIWRVLGIERAPILNMDVRKKNFRVFSLFCILESHFVFKNLALKLKKVFKDVDPQNFIKL